MRKILILFLVLFYPFTAFAVDDAEKSAKEVPVPEISYGQKVEIVVPLQKNPDVLSVTINQEGKDVSLLLTVSNECKFDRAKELGSAFLMKTKTVTLDDPAGKEEPGTGLYNYAITITRSNGKIIVEGIKAGDKKEIEWF